MKFIYQKIDYNGAIAIACWHYDPPYDFYNPAQNKIQDMVNGFLNPAYHYYTVWDHEENLVGYRCFGEDARVPGGDYREEALDMGGGLRPDLTGQGLGAPFMRSAIDFALEEFSPKAFRATVASFNIRALRVCESVGYRKIIQFYSPKIKETFIILWRDIN